MPLIFFRKPRKIGACHLRQPVESGLAKAPARFEVTLAVEAVVADKGAVLAVRPVATLGFTPGKKKNANRGESADSERTHLKGWEEPAPLLSRSLSFAIYCLGNKIK